jgi:replication factor C subunit 3/5
MSTGLLWVDRHRPTSLAQLRYNADVGERLRRLCATGDIPHLLLYGPSGAGKRTLAACALRELYGSSAEKRKVTHRVFKVGQPPRDVELTTVSSAHHIEVNPSDAGVNDRLVVQELIKEIASTAPIDVGRPTPKAASDVSKHASKTTSAANSTSHASFKLIILHEVDQMSRLAQQALRRTMEKYAKTCRLILIAESSTKVLEPLRSRCLGIRVPLPSSLELSEVLSAIGDREGLDLPARILDRIVSQPDINTRRAILQLEAVRICAGSLQIRPDAPVERSDWENVCHEIAFKLTQRQNVDQLVEVRKLLQALLAHAVPEDVILRRVVQEILLIADDEIAAKVCNAAAIFDARLTKGSKAIFHLEAFAARFMQIYSEYLKGVVMVD